MRRREELRIAIKSGDSDEVKSLLEHKVNPNQIYEHTDGGGGVETPLSLAIRNKLGQIAILLIQHGANVNNIIRYRWLGNEDRQYIVPNAYGPAASPRFPIIRDESMLSLSLQSGLDNVTALLIERKADVRFIKVGSVKNNYQNTQESMIHLAIKHNASNENIRVLIRNGVDLAFESHMPRPEGEKCGWTLFCCIFSAPCLWIPMMSVCGGATGFWVRNPGELPFKRVTPIEYARFMNRQNLIQLLTESHSPLPTPPIQSMEESKKSEFTDELDESIDELTENQFRTKERDIKDTKPTKPISTSPSMVSSVSQQSSVATTKHKNNKVKKMESDKETISEEYDLVLMLIDEKQEIKISKLNEFLQKNKQFQRKPILIKQGHTFVLYGQSETGEWKLTHGLDASKFKQLQFGNRPAMLSASLKQEQWILKLSILTARRDEILRKKERGEPHSRLDKELEVRLKEIKEIEEQLRQDSKDQDILKGHPTTFDSSSSKMLPVPTKGGGDCALHAILGEWNPFEKQIVCPDVKGKREKIRAVIIDKDNKEPLQGLIVEGIKELIMSGRVIGDSSRALHKRYREFLTNQKELSSMTWSEFQIILQKHEVITEYIKKNHRLASTALFRNQFYDALNRKEGELYGRILSLPELNEAFKEYSQLQNTAFDWTAAISELKDLKKEYADFVGTSQVWLLPSELAIIAHIFNVRVIYYPSSTALPLTLNPEGSSTVEVQFDDVGHFERLELSEHQSVFTVPAHQIPLETYQEITLKKGHTLSEPELSTSSEKESSLEKLSILTANRDSLAKKAKAEEFFRNGEEDFFGGRHHQALRCYLKLKNENYPIAYLRLIKLYKDSLVIAKNRDKAKYWSQKAAEQITWIKIQAEKGNSEGQYALGFCYENGIGVSKNLEKAFWWYKEAAEKNYVPAQHSLFEFLIAGRGTEKNEAKAIHWCRLAADRGFAAAQYDLGICLRKSIEEKDQKEAVAYYTKAADQGYAPAQYNLGCCWEKGNGIGMDEKIAMNWFKKAAEQELVQAQYAFGNCLKRGVGGLKDEKTAVIWYKKAAEKEYAPAQFMLGACLQYGNGIQKDKKEAIIWYRKAAEKNNSDAQFCLGVCLQYGIGVKKDMKAAIDWYRKAALQGNTDAERILGTIQGEKFSLASNGSVLFAKQDSRQTSQSQSSLSYASLPSSSH